MLALFGRSAAARHAPSSAHDQGSTPRMNVHEKPTGHLVPTAVGDLEVGMYVAELDRPWLGTPFLVQGFHIKDDADIEKLAAHCRFVLVDPRRHEYQSAITHKGKPKVATTMSPIDYRGQANEAIALEAPDRTSMREEVETVKPTLDEITSTVADVYKRIRSGRALHMRSVASVVDPIIASVLRNRSALAALVRIKKKDDYTYSHSISTAVWAVVIGRTLDIELPALRTLAMGCTLMDVGKVALPRELLEKPGALSSDETALVRRHVDASVRILTKTEGVDPRIIEIVQTHHERFDGSGYPQGLSGTAIPLGGRIAGLADSYDAMITPRPYAEPKSSYQAMQELARQRDVRFQGELVERLVQAIGVYPTGSLVELNTGEVAIVHAQNPSRRLKPKVIVILNADKQPLPAAGELDLLELEQRDGPAATRITKELPPGAHGINPEDYYD
jgi:HD-GYP domain-containing protein (c-di-GMP phosphodiesterase class II)